MTIGTPVIAAAAREPSRIAWYRGMTGGQLAALLPETRGRELTGEA